MHLVYALETLPDPIVSTLFLAGPTPRDAATPSWRPEALQILSGLGYGGAVLIPEPRSGEWRHSYVDQITWEEEMRARSDLIVFWVPRGIAHMPAFTTNIEFGEDYDSCRCLYGRPEDAPKNRYLDARWREVSGAGPHASLDDLLAEAAGLLGEGAARHGAERDVPLGIWRSPAFAAWHDAVRASGDVLGAFRLRYAVPRGKRHPASPIGAFLAEVTRVVPDGAAATELLLIQPGGTAIAASG